MKNPSLDLKSEKVFGELGKLATDGVKVQCHICGKWYHHLGEHITKKHQITCDEYRKEYELNRQTSLYSPVLKEKTSKSQSARLKELRIKYGLTTFKITHEQRIQGARLPRRLEGRKRLGRKNNAGIQAMRLPEIKEKAKLACKSPEVRAKNSQWHKNRFLEGKCPLFQPEVFKKAHSTESVKKGWETRRRKANEDRQSTKNPDSCSQSPTGT